MGQADANSTRGTERGGNENDGVRSMPERDVYHDVVKRALLKEGWEITHDPLVLKLGDARLYVDLGAAKLIEATKEGRYIAVEIKSFIGASFFAEFHTAIGQFMSYQTALSLLAPDRVLYLAMPLDTYEAYCRTTFVQTVLDKAAINLMVYSVLEEVIVLWEP